MLGRFDQVLQLNRHAVGLDPLNADSWESLAETEFFMGRPHQAAVDCKKELEVNPDIAGLPIWC